MFLHWCCCNSKMGVCYPGLSEHQAHGEPLILLKTNSLLECEPGQLLKSLSKRGRCPNWCEWDQKPSNSFIKYGGQSGTRLNMLQMGCLCRQKLSYWFPSLWQWDVSMERRGMLVKNLNILRGENRNRRAELIRWHCPPAVIGTIPDLGQSVGWNCLSHFLLTDQWLCFID